MKAADLSRVMNANDIIYDMVVFKGFVKFIPFLFEILYI